MDALSFRLANTLLANDEASAGLEIIVSGPTLKFNQDTRIALTGASIQATLDGEPVAMNTAIAIQAGQTLKLGKVLDGARTYLAIQGGIDCPEYLGSRSTFTLGQFGGHAGRALLAGDVLHINQTESKSTPEIHTITQPEFNGEWQIRVIYGRMVHQISSPKKILMPSLMLSGRCTLTQVVQAFD
ncbi:urea carboxylase [Vibrio astriarenae]|nr:urea carboxylase [Vibrio sp. C7]